MKSLNFSPCPPVSFKTYHLTWRKKSQGPKGPIWLRRSCEAFSGRGARCEGLRQAWLMNIWICWVFWDVFFLGLFSQPNRCFDMFFKTFFWFWEGFDFVLTILPRCHRCQTKNLGFQWNQKKPYIPTYCNLNKKITTWKKNLGFQFVS